MHDRETVSELSPSREEEENSENEEEFMQEAINQVDRSQGISMRKRKAVSYKNKLLNIWKKKKMVRKSMKIEHSCFFASAIFQENDR
jgi:hypothetical protein